MSPTMRAAQFQKYGGPEVLSVGAAAVPSPGPGQLLIRVGASGLNPKDLMVRAGRFRLLSGLRGPHGVGFDWAGTLVAHGPGGGGWPVGTRLFGMLDGFRGASCAEYLVTDIERCAEAPVELDLVAASALPLASLTALQALRDLANLAPGQTVLINGAAGGVGTVAVQIAKVLGATVHATSSPGNHELLRSLGADEVSDYRDLDQNMQPERYDVAFDVFGKLSFARVRPWLTARGLHITTVPNLLHALDIARTLITKQRVRLVAVRARRADLELIASLVDRGALRPVIDRVLPLESVVDAHRHIATKHTKGKVVVRIGGGV
ncbi:MAG: zinc-containing alcohol dehydrogenase [Myxococcaceae bacterium]|nr:zinc-containing alcohol dehydrogenase [Myxococcaceae bacterium]